MTDSALHCSVKTATMASADFCQPIPTPLDDGSTRQVGRPPRVSRATFIPYTRRIYFRTLPYGYRALEIMASSPGCGCLICGSCSSGRDFAYSFLPTMPRGRAVAVRLVVPAIGPTGDLHPQVIQPSPQRPEQRLSRRYAPCLAHHEKAAPQMGDGLHHGRIRPLRSEHHVPLCVGSPRLADAAILGRFSDIQSALRLASNPNSCFPHVKKPRPLWDTAFLDGGGGRIRTHGACAQRFSRPPP